MGLITPEGGGFRAPARRIERDAPPEGFEWVGGILQPVATQGGLVSASAEDVAKVEAKRAEMDEEARKAERLPWQDLGIGKSAFMMPSQFDFMQLMLQAVAARSGLQAPFEPEDLLAYLEGYMSKTRRAAAREAEKDAQYQPEAAAQLYNSFAKLYRAFRPEFRANRSAQDTFFSSIFFTAKFVPEESKWSAGLFEFLLEELPSLDRNTSAYVVAKGIISAHAEKLGASEAAALVNTLKRNNDLYSDLGFLLYASHPEVFGGPSEHAAKINSLSASQIAKNAQTYAPIAFNELPTMRPKEGSKVGYEIEVLMRGQWALREGDLEDRIAELSVVDLQASSMDGGGTVYELRTGNGGTVSTSEAALELVRLGSYLQRAKDSVALASVHVNLDVSTEARDKGYPESPFIFRRVDNIRAEMQQIAKPVPRVDTPFVNEMTVLIDQTEVLRRLYEIPSEAFTASFIEERFGDALPSIQEYFKMDTGSLALEFYVALAQQEGHEDLVPALLRLYARSALPASIVQIEFREAVFAGDSSDPVRGSIPYSAKVREFLMDDDIPYPERTKVTERINLTFAELMGELKVHPLIFLEGVAENLMEAVPYVRGPELLTDIESVFLIANNLSFIYAFLNKVGDLSFTEIEPLLVRPTDIHIEYLKKLADYSVKSTTFEELEGFLRNESIAIHMKRILIEKLVETEPTPKMQAFMLDETVPKKVRELLQVQYLDASETVAA